MRILNSVALLTGGAISAAVLAGAANADPIHAGAAITSSGKPPIQADSHAPIGVMGDHLHKKGEWMISYRFMRMEMADARIGNDKVSPETIATTVPNRFFGAPGQPPTLRVVPLEMTMDMHMVGAMYAPSDRVTLMAMASYVTKEMDHVSFAGPAGTVRRGNFTTKSRGIGDTTLSALVGLGDWGMHHLHLNAGVSLPTGSIDEEDDILTPLGTRPRARLPYSMQNGSGTFDLLPGLTYTAHRAKLSWGAQYNGAIRLGENDADYSLGDRHQVTGWAGYRFVPTVSASVRLSAETMGQVDGRDIRIAGPVQTADPDNYGGERLTAALGLNYVGQSGVMRGHRLALEVGLPVYEDLNGPQMAHDYHVTLGYQKAF